MRFLHVVFILAAPVFKGRPRKKAKKTMISATSKSKKFTSSEDSRYVENAETEKVEMIYVMCHIFPLCFHMYYAAISLDCDATSLGCAEACVQSSLLYKFLQRGLQLKFDIVFSLGLENVF